MNFLDANALIALGSLILAITTTLCGAILWYVQTEKKKYAAERDFNHLKNNIKQLSTNISYLTEGLDKQYDQMQRDLFEIRIHLGISQISDRPSTSLWEHRPNNRD